MLMDGGVLEALHEADLVGMEHRATSKTIYMIISSDN
ncbi:protein of unknown function [Paraburkholderia dioscoreae]|uniref:Uncharacterized protein n=1 Tax=Paraburkholderia dioscoreae TaxID=2604047 RepID=A0A5Q4YSC6_9BURK|nr:protein of unknown function [Paraburkholderia dioscoreae]